MEFPSRIFIKPILSSARDWPHTLLATATHDTKRGEDARARLNVLSEIPDEWEREVFTWAALNKRHKTMIDEKLAPDADDEYHFLPGAPRCVDPPEARAEDFSRLRERLKDYLIKALREGKRRTSWIRPNDDYEAAMMQFVERAFDRRGP